MMNLIEEKLASQISQDQITLHVSIIDKLLLAHVFSVHLYLGQYRNWFFWAQDCNHVKGENPRVYFTLHGIIALCIYLSGGLRLLNPFSFPPLET